MHIKDSNNLPHGKFLWFLFPFSSKFPDLNFAPYRKIPKISPGAYIFQRPFLRGLFLEGLIFGGAYLLRFKTDWASLIVGSKFNVLALFYSVFEGNFPSTSPQGRFSREFFVLPVWGAYIWRGDLTEDFLCYCFGGLIFGGAYTWRGLFFGILRYVL